MPGASEQGEIDRRNDAFWSELCGTGLARQLGITDASAESLARFDRAYFEMYPYLASYLPAERLRGKRVLEIGLGYGTLGQALAATGCRYVGVDVAHGPVEMMKARLAMMSAADCSARQASALALPFEDASFDFVYSIGCLHHTGNLAKAIDEVRRVLVPGGTAVVMIYNRHSFRNLLRTPRAWARRILRGRAAAAADKRAQFDMNSAGDAAPHTDFSSRRDVRRMFAGFSRVRIDARNFDGYRLVRREWLLGNLDRLLGLDLYVTATRE